MIIRRKKILVLKYHVFSTLLPTYAYDKLRFVLIVNEEVRKNNWLLGVIAVTRTCHLPTLQSYVDHHNLAFLFIGPTCSLKSELKNGSFHIFTKPALAGGLVDVMSHKEWEKVYYIYMSDEGRYRYTA